MYFSGSSQFVLVLGDSAELTKVSEYFRQQNRMKWPLSEMYILTTNAYDAYMISNS